jgi:hypothetical protein
MGCIEKSIFTCVSIALLTLFSIYIFFGRDCDRDRLVNSYIGMNFMWSITMIYTIACCYHKLYNDGFIALLFVITMILHILGTESSYPVNPGNCNHVFYYTAFIEFHIIPCVLGIGWIILCSLLACACTTESDNRVYPLHKVIHVSNAPTPKEVVINVTRDHYYPG